MLSSVQVRQAGLPGILIDEDEKNRSSFNCLPLMSWLFISSAIVNYVRKTRNCVYTRSFLTHKLKLLLKNHLAYGHG